MSIINPYSIWTSFSRPENPYLGQSILQVNDGKELFWYGTALGWLPDWSTEWGELGFVRDNVISDSATGAGVYVDIPGFKIVFSAILNRKYLSILELADTSGTGTEAGTYAVTDGANTILKEQHPETFGGGTTCSRTITIRHRSLGNEVGATIRKARRASVGGTNSGTTGFKLLTIYDVGPAGNPIIA